MNANLTNYTTIGLYSTTLAPHPVPTNELIAPPPNYFGPEDCYEIPEDFIYGASAAAGQVEGAIGLEGRTPSILERFITNGTGSDSNYVANENYFLYKQDIARMAAAGMKWYSFSISWSRILPFAKANTPVNKQAIDHYNDVIDTILEFGMQPVVTIQHFDSPYVFVDEQYPETSYAARASHPEAHIAPMAIQNKTGIWRFNGGFSHPEWLESYKYYSKIVLTQYADRVPVWITINSPFNWGNTPAGLTNSIKGHAEAYRFYKDELKGTGKMGIKIGIAFPVPKNPRNQTHIDAAQRYRDLYMGVLADPIMLGKQYPSAYTSTIPNVPLLTDAELARINGTADFFAINEYSGQISSPPAGGIAACIANSSHPLWPWCTVQETVSSTTGWALGYYAGNSAVSTPQLAIRACLNYLWSRYKLPIVISEFGFPEVSESTKGLAAQRFDQSRSEYYMTYLSEMLKTMYEDGVHVIGALAWAYVDNWEFGTWTTPFGMQTLNRTSQQRTYKKSFFDYVNFFEARMPGGGSGLEPGLSPLGPPVGGSNEGGGPAGDGP